MTDKECPVPGAHQLHEKMKLRPWLTNFAVHGVAKFCFYAVPDLTKCRFLRFFLKSSIFAAESWYVWHQDPKSCRDALSSLEQDREAENRALPLADLTHLSAEEWEVSAAEGTPFGAEQNGLGKAKLGAVEIGDEVESGADDSSACASADCSCAHRDDSSPSVQIGLLVSLGAILLALIGLVERLIYRRAEKKRLSGVRAAHTKQALFIALVAALFDSTGNQTNR